MHQSDRDTHALPRRMDVGAHTLCIRDDGTMDLLVNESQEQGRAEHGVHLTADDVYRLCIALCDYLMEQRDRIGSTGDVEKTNEAVVFPKGMDNDETIPCSWWQ